MKKILIFIIFIILITGLALIVDQGIFVKKESIVEKEKIIRQPAVAGTFYPESGKELNRMIDDFLEKADKESDERIQALIVPHASYQYSGQVAAYGYKPLIGKAIDTVFLIGNSHQELFNGISVYEKGYYSTPLGEVEINELLTKKLIDSNDKIFFKKDVHLKEHILEVQIPFLQKVLKNFKIVPIIIGENSSELINILIDSLKDLINENTLIIASSDLSHYPSYINAKYSDNMVIKSILTGHRNSLLNTISKIQEENIPDLQTLVCSQAAIETVLDLFENSNIKLLKYANSGDVTGNDSKIVGYSSILFSTNDKLGEKEQKRLLEIARQSVEAYVKTGKRIKIEEDELLNKYKGVFVTFKKHGELRGCTGVFESDLPLTQTVAEISISSAVNDKRFTPVMKHELEKLKYEISVLSPLKKVDSSEDVEIGKHGVKIVKGSKSGVFLPQVAVENNWNKDIFLSVLCTQKVGLLADCWKDPDIEIYIFTAQVFAEN